MADLPSFKHLLFRLHRKKYEIKHLDRALSRHNRHFKIDVV